MYIRDIRLKGKRPTVAQLHQLQLVLIDAFDEHGFRCAVLQTSASSFRLGDRLRTVSIDPAVRGWNLRAGRRTRALSRNDWHVFFSILNATLDSAGVTARVASVETTVRTVDGPVPAELRHPLDSTEPKRWRSVCKELGGVGHGHA